MRRAGPRLSTLFQSSLSVYLQEIQETPLLDEDEERELAARIQDGDCEARDQMVRANLRLVVTIARGYVGKGVALEDLIEEGNLGLLRAVEAFDPGMETRFSTYASFWIKQSIRRALAVSGKMIRIPTYMAALLIKWRRAQSRLHNERGYPPTPDEVAQSLGLSKRKLKVLKKAIQVYNSGERVEPSSADRWPLDETFVDGQAGSPDAGMIARDETTQVLGLVDKLEPRQNAIVRMRFGLNGDEPKTLKEVGEELGLTRERVRQLEREALTRLSEILQQN